MRYCYLIQNLRYHHQSVHKLGKNLITSALAKDRIIESIEHTVHPWCIGVQWPPEFLITNNDKTPLYNDVKTAMVGVTGNTAKNKSTLTIKVFNVIGMFSNLVCEHPI